MACVSARLTVTCLVAALALGGVGCLRSIMLDETLAAARRASSSANTLHDYEAARALAYAGVGQLEGMRSLRPNNPDGLLLLTKAWTGVGYAFALDDHERALERGDEVDAEYHLLRARAAFARAKFYGLELLTLRAQGFAAAGVKRDRLRAWLRNNYADRALAEELLWLGTAWVSYVSVDTENPDTISRLWVGIELVEHVVTLDETIEYGTAHAILGAFHARNAMGELDEAKQHFDRALTIGRGRYLPTQLLVATRYHCSKHDADSYARGLRDIVSAGDPLPEARLANVIAMRRARRYLDHPSFQEECGFSVQ